MYLLFLNLKRIYIKLSLRCIHINLGLITNNILGMLLFAVQA